MTAPDKRLLLLALQDNVYVLRGAIQAGEPMQFPEGTTVAPADLGMGHKLARHPIALGDAIIKYGTQIGSATQVIAPGEHVHLHNVTSNYTRTHSLEDARTVDDGDGVVLGAGPDP